MSWRRTKAVRGENSQDWVEDNVREKQNALDKYESQEYSKRTAKAPSPAEKVVMYHACLGCEALVDTKSDKRDDPDDESGQDFLVRPGKKALAEVQADQE